MRGWRDPIYKKFKMEKEEKEKQEEETKENGGD